MRKELGALGNELRLTFTATFERYGEKSAYKGPPLKTLLFKDVQHNNKIVADHIWLNMTKGFEQYKLNPGDVVQFDGRVKAYEKGYKGYRDDDLCLYHPIETDFKISHPTKITIISRA